MTFTFQHYKPSSVNEYGMNDAIGKVLGGYEHATSARYLNPMLHEQLKQGQLMNEAQTYQNQFMPKQLQEALTSQQLHNKYYGPNMQSEMDLRRAQTGEAGARTGLIGEQTRGAHISNQYLPQELGAKAESARQNQMRAQMINDVLRRRLQGGGPQYTPGEGGAPFAQGQGMGSPPMQGQNMPGQMSGYPQMNDDDITNKVAFGTDSFTPRLKEYLKSQGNYANELGKGRAKYIEQLGNDIEQGRTKQETYDKLNELLGSSGVEEIIKHPLVGQKEAWWYAKNGTPEQKRLVGELQAYTGNIIKDASRDFAGQFRKGEQDLLETMKPNIQGDSLGQLRGKAEALTYINKVLISKREMQYDLMTKYGMSSVEAGKIAMEKVDRKAIEKEVQTILKINKMKQDGMNLKGVEAALAGRGAL